MSKRAVAIRVDSGRCIGIGHVMRCLTLAQQLRVCGCEVVFVSKPHLGHVASLCEQAGFLVLFLALRANSTSSELEHAVWLGGDQSDDATQFNQAVSLHFGRSADWIVVDHYGIDAHWEGLVSKTGACLLAIDDLADRSHICEWLLDQTLGRRCEDYLAKVAASTHMLLGSEYVLLREEFSLPRKEIIETRERGLACKLGRVLVMMGGTDHLDLTTEVLKGLNEDDSTHSVTVVLGLTAPHLTHVKDVCRNNPKFTLSVNPTQMAALMLEHDLCIGAAGGSAWERCALGLPGTLAAFALNQRLIAEALVANGATMLLSHPIDQSQLLIQLAQLRQPEQYQAMVNNCLQIGDGRGAHRVANTMLQERASV